MILSYHPIFVGDKNLIFAGREPNTEDLAAIKAANAVILPQGCSKSLFQLARANCRHVFPNFEAKFKYPGKIGQIRLFKNQQVPHPKTEIYPSVDAFNMSMHDRKKASFTYPFVFKFNWGGEGETVFFIQSKTERLRILERARDHEISGRKGFLFQEYIPNDNKTLRVVVIGQTFISYWRVQETQDEFRSNLSTGAQIDADGEPEHQQIAVSAAKKFCHQTGINLAGFDFLFSSKQERKTPLFLEINYYFGRKALGGSEEFYQLLTAEIHNWIRKLNLGKKNKAG